MRKSTKAFQLSPMPEAVTFAIQPKTKKLFPLNDPDSNEIFIIGEGWKKIGKWKRVTIDPLSDPFTAEQVKTLAVEYGWPVPLGMIKGWGSSCLANNQSYGLEYHKHEVYTMARYGKVYDDFTDKVQAIGDRFVTSLLSNGFRMEGNTLWYDDNIIGFTDRFFLHPIEFVEHCLKGLFWMPPLFDSVGFDGLMVKLFIGKYGTQDVYHKKLDEIVSVKDRITHLTNKTCANEIGSIFELAKVFS